MSLSPRADWNQAGRVLCVRLDNMGDVLMTTPALRALKQSGAARRLTLLVSRSGAQLRPFLPDIDDMLIYDAAWSKNDSVGNHADIAMVAELQARRFDAAVIFTVYSQSALPAALMCHLAGIPLILAHSRENPYRLLNPWVRETEPEQGYRHEVQRQLDLVAAIGSHCADTQLSFSTRRADHLSMRAILDQQRIDLDGGVIVAHCGASAASRRYSPDRYARVFSSMPENGRPILLTGSAEERPIVERIMAECSSGAPLFDLTGRFSLGEFASLIEAADLLISNNTGPVHIAAALQTPIVDLYALTNPQHTPWQVEHRVLSYDVACKYCYRSVCPRGNNLCLNGIEPQAVVDAATDLLNIRCEGKLPQSAAA